MNTWSLYIPYNNYNYHFYGTILREGNDVYAFCDLSFPLSACGNDYESAIDNMKQYAEALLSNLDYNKELEPAVLAGKITRNNDTLYPV